MRQVIQSRTLGLIRSWMLGNPQREFRSGSVVAVLPYLPVCYSCEGGGVPFVAEATISLLLISARGAAGVQMQPAGQPGPIRIA